MNDESNEHDKLAKLGSESSAASVLKCEKLAVEAGAEASATSWSSSNDCTGEASSIACPSAEPNSTHGTYNSSEQDDDLITDEDIALFLEDRPYTAGIPATCAHLFCVQSVPDTGIDVKAPCIVCNSTDENWICLTCYQVYCSRYINKHMVAHTQETNHVITLSLSDVSVWCYSCDDYVYNEILANATKLVLDAKYGSPTDGLAI